MFSFITKHFRKGKKEEVEEVVEPKDYEWGDPVPYSLDFTGADMLRVSAKDCTRVNVDSVDRSMYDTAVIEEITELLKKLVGKGERKLDVDQCTLHTLTAYKENEPFALVRFYDGQLQDEHGLFIGSDEKLQKYQAVIFDHIKIDID